MVKSLYEYQRRIRKGPKHTSVKCKGTKCQVKSSYECQRQSYEGTGHVTSLKCKVSWDVGKLMLQMLRATGKAMKVKGDFPKGKVMLRA